MSSTSPRGSSRTHAETRARILAAARRLLEERGFHAVGVDEIAREAGVSRQAVYQGHFGSKSAMLLALVDEADAQAGIPDHVRRFMRAGTALEALDISVEIHADIESRIHRLARAFEAARTGDPAVEAAWQDRMTARRGIAGAVVRRLVEERLLANGWSSDAATDYLWSSLSVWAYESLVVDRGWSLEAYVESLKRALRGSLVGGDSPLGDPLETSQASGRHDPS